MMSYHPVEYKTNMYSHVYDNEYSKTKNNTDSSKCFNFVKHSEHAAKESMIEYLIDKRLSDNQVSKTRLENNSDNKDRLHDDQNKIGSKCNHEHMARVIPGYRYHQTQRGDKDGKKNNYKS